MTEKEWNKNIKDMKAQLKAISEQGKKLKDSDGDTAKGVVKASKELKNANKAFSMTRPGSKQRKAASERRDAAKRELSLSKQADSVKKSVEKTMKDITSAVKASKKYVSQKIQDVDDLYISDEEANQEIMSKGLNFDTARKVVSKMEKAPVNKAIKDAKGIMKDVEKTLGSLPGKARMAVRDGEKTLDKALKDASNFIKDATYKLPGGERDKLAAKYNSAPENNADDLSRVREIREEIMESAKERKSIREEKLLYTLGKYSGEKNSSALDELSMAKKESDSSARAIDLSRELSEINKNSRDFVVKNESKVLLDDIKSSHLSEDLKRSKSMTGDERKSLSSMAVRNADKIKYVSDSLDMAVSEVKDFTSETLEDAFNFIKDSAYKLPGGERDKLAAKYDSSVENANENRARVSEIRKEIISNMRESSSTDSVDKKINLQKSSSELVRELNDISSNAKDPSVKQEAKMLQDTLSDTVGTNTGHIKIAKAMASMPVEEDSLNLSSFTSAMSKKAASMVDSMKSWSLFDENEKESQAKGDKVSDKKSTESKMKKGPKSESKGKAKTGVDAKNEAVASGANMSLDQMEGLSDEELRSKGIIRIKGFTKANGNKVKTHYRKIGK